jgi:thymidylate synthase
MIIEENTLTEAWLKTLVHMSDKKRWEVSPVITKFNSDVRPLPYQAELEHDIDQYLDTVGQPHISTTAGTIFPSSLAGGNASVIDRFNKTWKYVKKDHRNNKGHYFRRLVAYNEKSGQPVNQLKHIIDTYNGIEGQRQPVHRRSALIALTFDPTLDHTAQPQRGFPCLQQICFLPKKDGTMMMNAIYATQHLDDRAYGNYVGLLNLGKFMAGEMNLNLTEINCIASILRVGTMSKSLAHQLADKYRKYV